MKISLIVKREQLLPFLKPFKAAQVMAVDAETTGLDPRAHKLRLIQVAVRGMPVLVIDCFSFLPDGSEMLTELFGTRAIKLFHNAKFDLQFLMAAGVHPAPIYDTMLAAQLLRPSGGPQRASLAALAQHYLEMELDKRPQQSDWRGELSAEQIEYAANDAVALLRIWDRVAREIDQNQLSTIANIEMDCARALAHMEREGILLDGEKWRVLTEATERARDAALASLYDFAGQPVRQTTLWGEDAVYGHNFDSNSYVLKLLHQNGIPVEATSRAELFPYRDSPLVRALIAYRKASKSLSSFLHPIASMIRPETGRLHPKYHQISAWSGRMSCDSPNIQQIPRDAAFRACFVAPRGSKLIIADYSQIELRVAAQISGDRRMIAAYEQGHDLHRLTASLIANKPMDQITKQERQAAKAVNFGLVFGMGAAGLQQYAQQTYGVEMSLQQAELFRARYFEAYPGIHQWHQALKRSPPREGQTLSGRKFRYADEPALPITTNSPVQGSAADITKKALGLLIDRIPSGARIIAVVHDEILMEAPAGEAGSVAALLRATMEEAGGAILRAVPVVAEVGVADNWAEK